MKPFTTLGISLVFTAVLILSFAPPAQAQGTCPVGATCGTLPHGAAYLIQVPANWNGTLFLYSHGYVVPGTPNPAMDVGDPVTGGYLLAKGYALAGSSYEHTGWAVQEGLVDQIEVLDQFNTLVGKKPSHTIAWGHSLGGMITAGLIQRYPERFDAALPMCGVLSGGVATWNTGLDGAFAFNTLLAGGNNSPLQLVHITNPGNLQSAEAILRMAQATQQGQARIALSAALGDVPVWFFPESPEPASNDFLSQEANQFLWEQQVLFGFGFALRAELEARARGNVSWNTGVDYHKQFERSVDRKEVEALYQAAGLDLDADLDTLNNTSRISADPAGAAVQYLEQNIIFNGDIDIPVLTMHTTGDGLVAVENESAYKDVVDEAGNGHLLRQTYVHRAYHCSFSPAETITAAQNLLKRLDTGKWPNLDDESLNTEAAALGPSFSIISTLTGGIAPAAPAFVDFKPAPELRPFDAFDACRLDFDEHACHGRFGLFHDRD